MMPSSPRLKMKPITKPFCDGAAAVADLGFGEAGRSMVVSMSASKMPGQASHMKVPTMGGSSGTWMSIAIHSLPYKDEDGRARHVKRW